MAELDETEAPTCDGCGATGVFAFCEECRTPDHPEAEEARR